MPSWRHRYYECSAHKSAEWRRPYTRYIPASRNQPGGAIYHGFHGPFLQWAYISPYLRRPSCSSSGRAPGPAASTMISFRSVPWVYHRRRIKSRNRSLAEKSQHLLNCKCHNQAEHPKGNTWGYFHITTQFLLDIFNPRYTVKKPSETAAALILSRSSLGSGSGRLIT